MINRSMLNRALLILSSIYLLLSLLFSFYMDQFYKYEIINKC